MSHGCVIKLRFQVQGSGQPGGKYFVKSFHVKVITPNGDIVPYQNCRALRGNDLS